MLNTIAWVAASSQVPGSYEYSGSNPAVSPTKKRSISRSDARDLAHTVAEKRQKKTASAFGGGKAGGPPNTRRRSAIDEDSNLPRAWQGENFQ